MALEKSSPEFADALATAIVALSYHFCGVDPTKHVPTGGSLAGRDKLDPVYKQVTENRDGPGPAQWEDYSSCGDQLHAILERIGVRDPALNRKSQKNYEVGANITRLQKFPFSRGAKKFERPPVGSLCLIWTNGYDAHALTVLGAGSDDGRILTSNFGATGMKPVSGPGADVSDSPLALEQRPTAPGGPTGYYLIGKSRRKLHTVITPAAIVPYIDAQIDLSGVDGHGLWDIDELADQLGGRYE
jgi:hypothetical protein